MSKDRKPPEKFVPASYARSNAWGIEQVQKLLTKQGYAILPKDEDYGVDIKAQKDSITEFYEVETKTNYTFTNQKEFPFKTVSFLGRKAKWKEIGFWYVIVCRETSSFIKCHSSVIFQEEFKEIKELDSQERKGKDTFYLVPKNRCEWLTLDDD